MAVRASTRVSIRWPPAEASEPTDTLVLSVDDYYVDLRVALADSSIDWALAGQHHVISENPTKVRFTHPFDSHYVPGQGEGEPDIGEFTKLPNGDDLETGVMAAPHLANQVLPYEEIWHELNPNLGSVDKTVNSDNNNASWILESVDQPTPISEGPVVKSYYAKTGRYFLALRRVDRANPPSLQFSAVRQDWDVDSNEWITKYSIGDAQGIFRIGQISVQSQTWKVGDTVTVPSQQEACVVRAIAR